ADDRRHRRELRLARGAPAALAGDQLVAALEARPHDDRLHEALRADRLRESRHGFVVEPLARLLRVRMDLFERQMRELGLPAADQDLEASPEATTWCVTGARQAPSPPS